MARSSAAAARLSLVALLVAAFVLVLAVAASAQSAGSAEEQMTDLINTERRAVGMAPLASNVQLTGVARGWTPQMVAGGKISHNPNLGTQVAGSWTRLGENVGVARPGSNDTAVAMVERLHRAFMNSPGHKANVLGDFEQIGLGSSWNDGVLWITVNFMKGGEVRPTTPVDESVTLSRTVFSTSADYVVIGRAEVFADALGGAGLAGDRAPILFTNGPTAADPDPSLHSKVAAEVDRLLADRGTVYLLGGTNAVSGRVERELAAAGYSVRRLAGPSRVETSVRVAEEIVRLNGGAQRILVARADDWPDAVTGGAYAAATRSPLVLTNRDSLHPATQGFLAANPRAATFALGGPAALADGVVRAARAERVSGPDRAATAVAVAERLWGRTVGASGDSFALAPGYGGDAWAYALAMVPWSAANSGPQLLMSHEVPAPVRDYLGNLGYRDAVKGDAMFSSAVPAPLTDQVRVLING